MRAVLAPVPGGIEALEIHELPDPVAGPGEVLIEVAAAGLNRTDVIQRKGRSNLPPGASAVLGLEVSGIVLQVGDEVSGFAPGDRVVALTDSGGYATLLAVPASQVAPVPAGVDLIDAAGIPEVAATVVLNLWMLGRYRAGERVLVHGGTGGVGSFAIQLLKAQGAFVAVTAGSDAKCAAALELGADAAVNYREAEFAKVLDGGVDLILDTVAGPYLEQNLAVLRTNGRIITIGRQGGNQATLDFQVLMAKKASLIGSLLRNRTPEEKAEIMRRTVELCWPLYESGTLRPVIGGIFPLDQVREAHSYFDSGQHQGKILLDCRN